MTSNGLTCLVTIHGIGFQQFPYGARAGYADDLHRALSARLGALLSDDPQRASQRSARGDAGAIYASSHWPPSSDATEPGLQRLGRRDPNDPSHILTKGADWDATLGDASGSIAHVALVYSRLKDKGIDWRSLIEMSELGVSSALRYGSVRGLARMIGSDLRELWAHRHDEAAGAAPGLRVREEHPQVSDGTPRGFPKVLTTVADDVGSYVCRNDLRERVRAFVCEALLRICLRDDVAHVVINAHSNGTVIAYDVLRELPDVCARKIAAVVTAGSPLRKFTQLWNWGYEAGSIGAIPGAWTNFWDEHDPVADPLGPGVAWRRGDALRPAAGDHARYSQDGGSLFHATNADSGEPRPVVIDDVRVNNLTNSVPGSLRSHDYWDNETEFVVPLADVLRAVADR